MRFLSSIILAAFVFSLISTASADAESDPDLDACMADFNKLPAADLREDRFFSKGMDRLAQFDLGMKCWDEKFAARIPKITEEDIKAARQREMDRRKFERTVVDRRVAMQATGLTLEFFTGYAAWNYIFHGCLIAEGGNVYAYDEELSFALTGRMTEQEYDKAVELAKNLGDEPMKSRRVKVDSGFATWTASSGGVTKILKMLGDGEGELSHPNALQLVEMISAWCPSAKEQIEFDERDKLVMESIRTAPRPPKAEPGTAEEARTMLQQAISELRLDPGKAVRAFDRVLWKDLSVLCVEENGKLVTRSGRPGWNNEKDKGVLESAVENRIDKISFTSVDPYSFVPSGPVAKEAFVTRVGPIACGVSYVK